MNTVPVPPFILIMGAWLLSKSRDRKGQKNNKGNQKGKFWKNPDITPLSMRVICYTPCNTVLELGSLLPLNPCSFPRPLLCIHYLSILHYNFKPWFCFWNSIYPTLPDPPHSMPIPIYHGRGFHSPILDLLIPLLHSWPYIVPSSYKDEPPMYHRPSLNID